MHQASRPSSVTCLLDSGPLFPPDARCSALPWNVCIPGDKFNATRPRTRPTCDHVLLHPLPGTPETPLDDQSKAVCPQLLNTPPRCVYTVCNQIALVIHIITSKLAWLHSCAQARCAPNQEPVVGTACVRMACSSAHGHAIHLYTLLDHAPWDIQRLPARWTRPESGRTTTPSHRLVSAHTERVTANASHACGGSSSEQVSPLPAPFLANIR